MTRWHCTGYTPFGGGSGMPWYEEMTGPMVTGFPSIGRFPLASSQVSPSVRPSCRQNKQLHYNNTLHRPFPSLESRLGTGSCQVAAAGGLREPQTQSLKGTSRQMPGISGKRLAHTFPHLYTPGTGCSSAGMSRSGSAAPASSQGQEARRAPCTQASCRPECGRPASKEGRKATDR